MDIDVATAQELYDTALAAYKQAMLAEKTGYNEGGASFEHWNQRIRDLRHQLEVCSADLKAAKARAAGRPAGGPIYTGGGVR